MQLSAGEIVADNKIVSLVGQGGWADVYLAEQSALGRKVAVKILHEHLIDDKEKQERFRREAKAASLLKHPNICQVYDYGTNSNGQPYCVMEYIEGETLSSVLERKGKLTVKEALPLFSALCDALACAHNAGILHRDLKPSNIMVRTDGSPVLLDFGIAKLFDQSEQNAGANLTQSGVSLGTAAYMSPEQIMGGAIDFRSDIYSLACVCYEVLTGQKPFAGGTDMQFIYEHVRGEVRPFPRQLNIPEHIEDAIFNALAKEPAERPSDVRAFERQLVGADIVVATQRPSRWRKKHVIAATIGVALVLAGGGLYWQHQRQLAQEAAAVAQKQPTIQELLQQANYAFGSGNLEQGRKSTEAMLALIKDKPDQLDTEGYDSIFEFIQENYARATSVDEAIEVAAALQGALSNSLKADVEVVTELQDVIVEMSLDRSQSESMFTPDFQLSPNAYRAEQILLKQEKELPALGDHPSEHKCEHVAHVFYYETILSYFTQQWERVISLVDRYEKLLTTVGAGEYKRQAFQMYAFRASAYLLAGHLDKAQSDWKKTEDALKTINRASADEAAAEVSSYAAEAYMYAGMTAKGQSEYRNVERLLNKIDPQQRAGLLVRMYRYGLFNGHANETIKMASEKLAHELASIRRPQSAEVLDLAGKHTTDEQVASLVGSNARFTAVDLAGTSIRDGVSSTLGKLSNLQRLNLQATFVDGKTMTALSKLPGLLELDASTTLVDDGALPALAAAPRLKGLSLARTAITSSGLRALARSKSISVLDLRETQLDDAGLGGLAQLATLDSLLLQHNAVNGSCLRVLPHLKQVGVIAPRTTRLDVSAVGKMKDLNRLALAISPVSGEQLAFLPKLSKLEELNLACTNCGDEVIPYLASLPNLKVLNMNHTLLTDAGVQMLAQCKNLRELRIGQTRVRNLAPLEAMPRLRIVDRPVAGD